MEYYLLTQDGRISEYARLDGLPKAWANRENGGPAEEDGDSQVISCYTDHTGHYLDFMERPCPVVSDRVKAVLERYPGQARYRLVVLTHLRQSQQTIYWMVVPESISCLSSRTERHKDGRIKKLVLSVSAIGNAHFFRVCDQGQSFLLVHADVAEAILALYPKGIQLTPMELER